ncbi:MAG: DedA family protein, partial [Betaproteobacteria bacterium]
MEISQVSEALQRDAAWVVFVNVWLQQAGFPVPAVPTLLLAGSLAAGPGEVATLLALAIVASVIADWMWYVAGRAFGYRVLSGLCRLSINPGSCVSQTEARFVRWGLGSLVVAKFIPGFSTVAPPIAGALRLGLAGFLLAAAVGAALWAGLALGAGWVLRDEVRRLIGVLEQNAGSALLIVISVLALWIAWKLWQKYRFGKLSALPHITPEALQEILAAREPLLFLDLRGESMATETG